MMTAKKPKGPPLWAVDVARKASRGMTQIQRRMAPPSAVLVEMVSGMWRPYALGLIAELGIADLLAGGARSVDELARETGSNAEALLRVLRPLAHDGILASPAPRTFALTSLSQPLRSDHPKSVRQSVRQSMSDWARGCWNDLAECVRTGEPAFPRQHGGRDLWTWFHEDAQEDGEVFHDSMNEFTRLTLPLILAVHDFSAYRRVLDLGGGQGTLVGGLLAAHAQLTGGVLDLPGALAGAPDYLAGLGVAQRCELIEGSVFGDIPGGWDAYLMKHILHGCSDAQISELLGHVREALPPGARFIALEMLVPEDPSGTYPAFIDIQMLVGSGGRERSASEYRDLFAAHGLKLESVARTASPVSLLVCSRA
ncbi:MAG: hypothetical protein KC503_31990 [Myxococcales bacterium]|nr:hypothetical protein [Myxococcales bacterium]